MVTIIATILWDNELIGELNVGEEIVKNLKKNDSLGWKFTDEKKADSLPEFLYMIHLSSKTMTLTTSLAPIWNLRSLQI